MPRSLSARGVKGEIGDLSRDGATASYDFEIPDGGQGTFGAAGTVVLTAATA